MESSQCYILGNWGCFGFYLFLLERVHVLAKMRENNNKGHLAVGKLTYIDLAGASSGREAHSRRRNMLKCIAKQFYPGFTEIFPDITSKKTKATLPPHLPTKTRQPINDIFNEIWIGNMIGACDRFFFFKEFYNISICSAERQKGGLFFSSKISIRNDPCFY